MYSKKLIKNQELKNVQSNKIGTTVRNTSGSDVKWNIMEHLPEVSRGII